jgi:tetratricopeptide (TPR) repeat protein
VGADADLQAGLARAFQNGDRSELVKAVDAALHLNPRHVDALLLRAEHDLDAEDYAASRRALERVLTVDPVEPRAWALHAVLAHLAGDAKGEARARDKALAVWPDNPEPDALIGKKLSEKYRFTEGAAYQRRALAKDARSLPARIQLAQDLLRLGPEHEKEGWALAEAVHAEDGYDVNAFNLVTLREHLAKMPAQKQGPFLVRMAPREAAVYGDEVLALLGEARGAIDGRYGFANPKAVTVEIYPEQADFAVRTFGTPGGAGYLGVCFGNLVTMNSPAGNVGVQSNWKAVLWHEYTHVVTLGLSRNKMPRWLSEGISVWEERRRDRAWGRRLTAKFQKMLRGKELVPLGALSRAFLDAKSGEHVMFAYFESALAVEFLVERYGFDALKAILRDLGEGAEINAAIAARTAPLPEVEKGFAAYARRAADEAIVDVEALLAQAKRLREAGDAAGERKALEEALAAAPDQGPALGRLMELAEAAGDHALLERATRGFLAVNPMIAAGWRGLGRALEVRATADRAAADGATVAYRKLLRLDPPDPADVHLRLARLLRTRNPREARRHVLDALAEAPRFREGHKLLLELQKGAAP